MNHNKKRNTAFLYEALTKEIAKCSLEGDDGRKRKAEKLLESFFSKGTPLHKDLQLYQSIHETEGVMPHIAEKIIQESKRKRSQIDSKKLFNHQSKLLNKIDDKLGQEVYSNFIPNYKSLATIYQVLNVDDMKTKEKVLLEDKLTQNMVLEEQEKDEDRIEPLDRLSYLKFVEKFNEKYGESLISEQKKLLSKYIYSLGDSANDFKVFLGSELKRLKESLQNHLENYEVFQEDEKMQERAEKVLEELDQFSSRSDLDKSDIRKIMKTQELLHEIEEE